MEYAIRAKLIMMRKLTLVSLSLVLSISLAWAGDYSSKRKKKKQKVERLTFTQAEFFDENEEFKYYEDVSKLPWEYALDMVKSLATTSELVYSFSSLNDETQKLETKNLVSRVAANVDENSLSIDAIFYGYDYLNLPEDADLPPNHLDLDYPNRLYPFPEYSFRVAGEESISTSAGTFTCTVIEAFGHSEELFKLWMIKDKPGVFAKIIEDKPGMWGHYYVFELQTIKLK